MALVLKKSSGESSAARRRPLLPDDRFIDGRVAEVGTDEVDDKFNGGKKKIIVFTIELPKFKDPQDPDGECRRVKVKANMPDKGKGVHEKSNLYKFVKTVMGKDPWAEDESFDLESIAKKKLPVRVMMSTSEPMEKEIIENEGDEPHMVTDYQFQWVSSYRSASGTAEETGEEASATAKPAAAAAKTPAPAKGAVAAKPAAAAPKPAAKVAAKPAPAPEPEPEPEAEPEAAAEESAAEETEEAGITEEQQATILAAMKAKAANEVGKKKLLAAIKAVGCEKPSEILTMSAEKVKAFCGQCGITFPEVEAPAEDDLAFLN